MKTVSRIVRRYILTAFAIVTCVFVINAAILLRVLFHFGAENVSKVTIGQFAKSFSRSPGGYASEVALEKTPFVWAMLLSDDGGIVWSDQLPEELERRYSLRDVASFSHWYLADYPVMVYQNDFGLLVAALPKGSLWRYNFYMESDLLEAFLSKIGPLAALDLLIVLLACLFLGWRASFPLRAIAEGIENLAQGQPVSVRASGSSAELAEQLNRTSRLLAQQAALINERDLARTHWITGVSHDIRTPLSLIMGYAQQIERESDRPQDKRRAVAICAQSEKIRRLIDDLNLTSKLRYSAQPLRLAELPAGQWLRGCLADFCDTLDERFPIEVEIAPAAERALLRVDPALMHRCLDNLLENSVRHNPDGCSLFVQADVRRGRLHLLVRDTGRGYPSEVLDILRGQSEGENSPHVLGLHLVRQIVLAHGGSAAFCNAPGAQCEICLPLAEKL